MSTFKPSDALLRSLDREPANPELVAGFMSGAMPTRGPSIGKYAHARQLSSIFRPRRPQRSSDRERSIRRRRTLASSFPMPPAMAGMLTTSQLSYARIVADEVRMHGYCDLCLDEIAARGGMCRKTAQRAQHRLAELGWITIRYRKRDRGVKHLPNLVRIISKEWLAWVEKGPKHRRKTGHLCPTTEKKNQITPVLPDERPQRALEGASGRCTGQATNGVPDG